MANLLYQTIEQISREKHIEPEVIVAAIEDAMIVAARKLYKTEEDLRAKFNPDSGQVEVYAVRPVVEEVTDPKKEFTLAEARRVDPSAEIGGEVMIPKPTDVLGRIAAQNRQASDHAKGARGRGRHHLQRIQRACWRIGKLRGEAHGGPGRGRGPGPRRSVRMPKARAVARLRAPTTSATACAWSSAPWIAPPRGRR